MRKDWLKDNPNYHSVILTSMHYAQLSDNAENLQKDKKN